MKSLMTVLYWCYYRNIYSLLFDNGDVKGLGNYRTYIINRIIFLLCHWTFCDAPPDTHPKKGLHGVLLKQEVKFWLKMERFKGNNYIFKFIKWQNLNDEKIFKYYNFNL